MKISQIQCLSFKQSRWQKSKCDNCLKFHSAETIDNNNNSNNNSSNIKEEKKVETIETVNKANINNKEMTIDNNQPNESVSSIIKGSTTPPSNKPIILQFADCLDFKSNQWRPNVCVTCFLPKNKHANVGISNIIPESTTPLISQSSQTSTITPISSSTSTSTSSISTHKTANNKTVITYISSTTTTTTTSSPPSSSISTLSPSSVSSASRSSSPVLKSVSTVVVPPLVNNNNNNSILNNKSMSTPGSPLQSRKSSPPIVPVQQSQQPASMISSNANNAIRPVLKRQFQSFPSNPKISKAILEECINVDPIILCKYTIESLPKNNISILKPTLVEFINQPDSHDDDEITKDEQQPTTTTTQPKQPIFNSKQSAIMDGITTHKSVSITISTLKSPSSTTTTTSTTTSIIAEEPSSPILTNNTNNKDTTNTIPMSPSLPSIPLHAFENNNIENIKNESSALGGTSNNNSRRNSMNPIVPLRLKSFSFSAPQSDSMFEEEDDPFFDFEDLSDDEDDQVDQDDNNNSRPNSNINNNNNNNNIPTTTITSTTTILQSPTSEKTLSTTTTTSSIPSPTTNSRSFSPLKDSNGVSNGNQQHVEPPLLKVPTNNVSTSTTTTTTSTKRRSIKMDQFKEKEDEWDHGVDLSSFLKRKPTLQRDFSYCNNKFMEITSVKEEAKRLHVGTGYIHQFAFEAFKDILEAKQMQINKAFERQKIDEPDCNMLTEELNSAKMLLDELLELSGNGDTSSSGSNSGGSSVNGSNSNSPSSSKNNTLNQQSICIKSE